MEEKREKIEKVVRNCSLKLGNIISEEKIQKLINKLANMKDLKEATDLLALSVDRVLEGKTQNEQYKACMEEILKLAGNSYKIKEDIIEQVKINKSRNYTPGNISIEENHQLIEYSLKPICDKLNELGADYYLVGALSNFIATQTPLFRYHGDIDFMIEEKDIEKVREALQGTDYKFSDNRFNNKKRLQEGVGHTQGEHEVIANHKENEFHLGFFLFRREQDKSITVREYFMQEENDGKKVPMVLERKYPKELVDLEYQEQEVEFAGTKFRTSTPESVYMKKIYTRHEKDLLDIEALKDKIDEQKIADAEQYKTTLTIVPAIPEKSIKESVENVIKKSARYGKIEEQVKLIQDLSKKKDEKVSENSKEIKD